MKTKIQTVDGKKELFLIFDNGQLFRIQTDEKLEYTKLTLDLGIEHAKLVIKSEILKKQDQDLGHLGLKIMYKHI